MPGQVIRATLAVTLGLTCASCGVAGSSPARPTAGTAAKVNLVAGSPISDAFKDPTSPEWILIWSGASTRVNHKYTPNRSPQPLTDPSIVCRFVYLVDANTGHGSDGYRFCQPKTG